MPCKIWAIPFSMLLKCFGTLPIKKQNMRSANLFSIFLLLISLPLTAQQNKKDTAQYRYSLQASASEMYESFVMNDPALKLSRGPIARINIGFAFAYNYNDRVRFLLDYQREKLGNSALFINPTFFQGIINPSIFSKFGLFYERDILPPYEKKRLSLFLKGGAAFSFASSPFSGGTSFFGSIAPNGDTLEFISETIDVKRPSFVSLGGAIGLRYAISKRWFANASINRMWNITSNDITTNDIRYKAYDLPNVSIANSRTTGNVLSYRLAIEYNFVRNEKRVIRKARIAKANTIPDSVTRFALSLITSTNFTKLYVNDPAGYLSHSALSQGTFGFSLRYRLSKNWHLSTGFETFPNAVSAIRRDTFASSNIAISAALQFPVSAEYKVLSIRKKIKLDVFIKSGLVFGVQTYPANFADYDLTDTVGGTQQGPGSAYFEAVEKKSLPNKSFVAITAGVFVNLHLSRTVFLLGYVNQQIAFTKRPFIQKEAYYKVRPDQANFYRARLHSTGTVFQVGFGLGFRF